VTNPKQFLKILQYDRKAYGIDKKTGKPVPGFIPDTAATIEKLIPIITRIKNQKEI